MDDPDFLMLYHSFDIIGCALVRGTGRNQCARQKRKRTQPRKPETK
jgi:hypothetical protein